MESFGSTIVLVLYCVTAISCIGNFGNTITLYCVTALAAWEVLGVQGYLLCHCPGCMGSFGSTMVRYCVTALAAWGVLGVQ